MERCPPAPAARPLLACLGLAAVVTSLLSCSSLPKEIATPLLGTLELEVSPNPIVAEHVAGDTYDFPFDIIMREKGGVDVTIEDFTVDVTLGGVVKLFSQTFPASEITRRGYPAEIATGKFLRFTFRKRMEVDKPIIFRAAVARVTARTIDRNGTRNKSELKVSITR